jgi:putative oxidoreductase
VLAQALFAASLFLYFWASGLTKLGYDPSQLVLWQHAVVLAGTWAEFILPVCITLGIFTRLTALGMIGFIAVQSLTDFYGHGGISHPATLGAWFDKVPDGVILDQRAFWVFLLLVLVLKGAGAISLDRVLGLK